jgi:hypothetical protein
MRDHVCPSEVMLSQADVFVFVGFFFGFLGFSWVHYGSLLDCSEHLHRVLGSFCFFFFFF